MPFTGLGKVLLLIGIVFLLLGLLLLLSDRIPLLGRLPGDIVIRGKRFVFYFPIVTTLLVSAIVSLVLWLLSRR